MESKHSKLGPDKRVFFLFYVNFCIILMAEILNAFCGAA